jgi:hypothetical protein
MQILPNPGTPIVLANGMEIDPLSGNVINEEPFVKVLNTREQREVYAITQKKLTDLPLPTDKLNGISIILVYKMIGISDKDISTVTGLTEEQIGRITLSDAFSELRQMVVENIHANDSDTIRSFMKENAILGVQRVGQLINSPDEAVALSAAKDALDREGYRPVDVVEHRHKMEGGLVIEVIKRDHSEKLPIIETNFTDITETEGENSND